MTTFIVTNIQFGVNISRKWIKKLRYKHINLQKDTYIDLWPQCERTFSLILNVFIWRKVETRTGPLMRAQSINEHRPNTPRKPQKSLRSRLNYMETKHSSSWSHELCTEFESSLEDTYVKLRTFILLKYIMFFFIIWYQSNIHWNKKPFQWLMFPFKWSCQHRSGSLPGWSCCFTAEGDYCAIHWRRMEHHDYWKHVWKTAPLFPVRKKNADCRLKCCRQFLFSNKLESVIFHSSGRPKRFRDDATDPGVIRENVLWKHPPSPLWSLPQLLLAGLTLQWGATDHGR